MKMTLPVENHKTSIDVLLYSTSLFFLMVSNFVPLYGVFVLHWQWYPILFLYWAENVIVGFFNFFKIIIAAKFEKKKYGVALFFLIHFGLFVFCHGLFLSFVPHEQTFVVLFVGISASLFSIFLSHLASFILQFILAKGYTKITDTELLYEPYPRVIILQVVIIFGAIVANLFQSNALMVALLVVVKTVVDAVLYLKKQHVGVKVN